MAGKSVLEAQISARIRAYLREAMADRRYDKARMARELGVDDGNFGRLLSGERKSFTAGLVVAICRVCQVNPTRLLHSNPPKEFFGDEEPPPEIR